MQSVNPINIYTNINTYTYIDTSAYTHLHTHKLNIHLTNTTRPHNTTLTHI